MIGRRRGSIDEIEQGGDYFGPALGWTGDDSAVFFLLPGAVSRRVSAEHPLDGLHHVTAPPHSFRECADGSVEIRESIGAHGWPAEPGTPFVWHGYLDEGHSWRQV